MMRSTQAFCHGDRGAVTTCSFEFQGEATANPAREQGTEGGKKRERANDGMVVAPKTPCFLGFWEPWVGTAARGGCAGVADQPAREADQDRCHGRAPRPLRSLPDGRSRGAERTVRKNTAADRRAGTTNASSERPHQCVVTTGGVRPNDEAKGQIDGSIVVLGARIAEAVVETVSAAAGFLETQQNAGVRTVPWVYLGNVGQVDPIRINLSDDGDQAGRYTPIAETVP